MSRDFSTVVDDHGSERPKTRAPGIHFDIKRFLNLRLVSVIVIAAVLMGPFALAGWFSAPYTYTATAVLQFRSSNDGIIGQDSNGIAAYDKYVGTELAKIRDGIVLNRVLEIPEVQSLASVAKAVDKLQFVKGTIRTNMARNSELVRVSCTMESRSEALVILRNVMEVYEKQAINTEADSDTKRISAIKEEIDNRTVERDRTLKRIRDIQGALGALMVGDSPGESTETEQYLAKFLEAEGEVDALEESLSEAKIRLSKIEKLEELHREDRGAPIYEFDIDPTMVQRDLRVSSAQADLSARESRVALLLQSHKPDHPALQAAKRELESVKSNVASREQQARTDALRTIRGQIELSVEELTRRLNDASDGLIVARTRYDEFVEKQGEIRETASAEQANIEIMREEAEAELRYITSLNSELRSIQLNEKAPARVSIASQPYAPQSKDRKKKTMLAAMGVMAALGIGLAYGVLRELLDQKVRTRQDMARITDIPTIASIPHLDEDPSLAGANSALLLAQHPNTTVADEYRRIIARILYPEDNAAEISSLLVVSASTQEGKTSIAANLAIALEQANRRVLLIDLSSQKPDVERTFGLTPSVGLSELMSNPHAREELIRATAFENLGVVGPGTTPGALAGRLASREMMDFMEWADEHFDHLIVDTPPMLLMSDAKLLAPAVDGVLFVVGVGSSSLGMVGRCLRDLDQLRANVIGVVINGIRSMRGGYLRKNQSLYHAYTERASEGAATDSMPEINVLDEEVPEPVDPEVVLLPFEDDTK